MKRALLKVAFISLFVFICSFSFGLPGVQDYIKTQSGEFVYYRDFTYIDEVYIGFLQYDELTYAARYYAPKSQKGSVIAEIVFNIEKDKDYLNLIGEKIITAPSDGNVEPLNYLHELLYEFNSRRSKLGKIDLSKTYKTTQNFAQFGGEVIFSFDFYIPLFNLSKIQDSTGKTLFEVVTIGCLTSSEDNSFFNFSGSLSLPKTTKNNKKDSTKKLNKQWTSSGENMWFLGDNAFLLNTQSQIQNFTNLKDTLEYLTKINLYNSSNTFCYLPKTKIISSENSLIIDTLQFNNDTKKWIKNTKIISYDKDNLFNSSFLSVFYNFYNKNSKYFDNIVKKLSKSSSR